MSEGDGGRVSKQCPVRREERRDGDQRQKKTKHKTSEWNGETRQKKSVREWNGVSMFPKYPHDPQSPLPLCLRTR